MKTLSKELNGIVDRIKKDGFTFEIDFDVYCGDIICISNEQMEFSFELGYNGNILYVQEISGVERMTQKVMEHFLRFAERYAEEKKKILYVSSEDFGVFTYFNAEEYLKRKGYEKIGKVSNELIKCFYFNLHPQGMIKKKKREIWEKCIPYYLSLENQFMNTTRELICFELKDEVDFGYDFHYKGFCGTVTMEIEDETVNLVLTDEETEKKTRMFVEKSEDFAILFQEMFMSIEKKMKIKNVFNPPKYFFSDIVENHITWISLELMDKLYQTLRKEYHPTDIEEWSFHNLATLEVTELKRNQYVFMFKEHFIYIDGKEKKIEMLKKEKSAIDQILDIVTGNIRKKLNEQLLSS